MPEVSPPKVTLFMRLVNKSEKYNLRMVVSVEYDKETYLIFPKVSIITQQ